MPSPYKSKEFKALLDKWDERLKESGLKDVERLDKRSGELKLIAWDSHYFSVRNHPDSFAIKHEYYYQAHQFLNSHKFKSHTDRHIWEMHADGQGLRVIAQTLKNLGIKTNKDYVATTVNRLKKAMREATERCKKEISSLLDQE
jgi:hypothetical protein